MKYLIRLLKQNKIPYLAIYEESFHPRLTHVTYHLEFRSKQRFTISIPLTLTSEDEVTNYLLSTYPELFI